MGLKYCCPKCNYVYRPKTAVTKCPKCGHPPDPGEIQILAAVCLAGMLIVFVLVAIHGPNDKPPKRGRGSIERRSLPVNIEHAMVPVDVRRGQFMVVHPV